jgi:hypothetical protein
MAHWEVTGARLSLLVVACPRFPTQKLCPMSAYSNERDNAAGAIPVYIVATPIRNLNPPNEQDNVQGAIPIQMVAPSTSPTAGAIPVRVVGDTSSGPWPSDQGQDAGAIPVYISASPKAMPVWDAGVEGRAVTSRRLLL